MRIGFMGVQGTGKSTLVDLFLQYHPEYSRSVNIQRILNSKFGLNINGGADYNTQFAISAHYASEVNAYENYITDRTILDTFVYARTCNRISSLELQTIENTFEKAVEDYSVIFYLPVEFEPPEDGIRVTDSSYRDEVDNWMKFYKEKHSSKIVELRGSVQERYIKLLKTLKTLNEKE